jgi:alpha-tubulin suppressor-like RCC1 family protein
VQAIAAGAGHTLALKSNGTIVAWGDNSAGQTTVPVGLTGVQGIAAGYGHTAALNGSGTVVTWGWNDHG